MTSTLREEAKPGKPHIYKEEGKWFVTTYGSFINSDLYITQARLAKDWVYWENSGHHFDGKNIKPHKYS